MKKLRFLLCLTCVLPVLANAGWREGKITSIQNNAADHVILKWTGPMEINCQNTNQIILKVVHLGNSQAMFDRVYAGVLAASATQKPVRFNLTSCEGNSMIATSVQICATDPCVP